MHAGLVEPCDGFVCHLFRVHVPKQGEVTVDLGIGLRALHHL